MTIDFLIQTGILALIFWGLVVLASYAPRADVHTSARDYQLGESIGIAIVVAIVFLVFFGYFILFEAFWHGQTPGKKLMGLRVVRDGGYPLDFAGSAVRNLIRVGEAALGAYAIAAIACVLSPENKRLGDMAAGTIVVREGRGTTLAHLVEQSQDGPRASMLTEKEQSIIDQFVARRKSLTPAVRMELAARIADQVRPRVSSDLRGLSDEELLVRLSAS